MSDKLEPPGLQESHLLTVGPIRGPKANSLLVPICAGDEEEKTIAERTAAFEKDRTTLDAHEAIARIQRKLNHSERR